MAVFRTQAVVLRAVTVGESDALLTLYTQATGKLRAVAKGAKRSKKRFMNCLDLYGRIQAGLEEKRGRETMRLDSAAILSRPDLASDPLRFGLAGLAAELIIIFCAEKLPDQEIFAALAACYDDLADSPDPVGLVLAFALKLLGAAGFGPNLEACLACQTALDELEGGGLDAELGGLVCPACRPGARRLSKGALMAARMCQRLEAGKIGRMRFPAGERQALWGELVGFLRHQADRDLDSLHFLGQVGFRH